MLMTILSHCLVGLACLAGGAYVGYRYGARAVGDVRIAADAVKKL